MPSPNEVHEPTAEPRSRQFDLRDVVDTWYRRRFLILSAVFLSMLGMEFANWVTYPIFESQVEILIESPAGLEVPFSTTKLVFKKSEITQTRSEMLTSRQALEEVVRQLRLDERPDHPSNLRGKVHALKDRVVEWCRDAKGAVKRFVVVNIFGGQYTSPRRPTRFQQVVAHLQRSSVIFAEPISNTDILVLGARDRDPDLAAKIANTLVDVFLANDLEARRKRARATRDLIKGRLAVLDPQMSVSHQAIADFKEQHGIVVLKGQMEAALANLTLLEQTFWDVSQKESARGLSAWTAVHRETTARRDADQRQTTALNEKLSELAELQAMYRPDHPRVLATQAAVEAIRRQVSADRSGSLPVEPVGSPDMDTESLKEALRAKIGEVREELAELSRLDTQYQTLVWDREHHRETLKFLTRKREDASIAEYTLQAEARVITPAQSQYKPVRPQKWLNRALVLLTSLAMAIGWCALLEYLDRTVRTPEAVDRLIGLQTLGSIPYSSR